MRWHGKHGIFKLECSGEDAGGCQCAEAGHGEQEKNPCGVFLGGSTKAVAETAAQTLHADLFEITPAQPYTDADLDYRDDASRVSKEHNDPNRHTELQNPTPPNFSSYDVVLVGAPIWWHEAAWPINDFLTKNDFTGKTVVPFVTSYSDPLGDSGKKMEALAGTGNWQEGMRFKGRGSQDEIEAWAKGLKF